MSYRRLLEVDASAGIRRPRRPKRFKRGVPVHWQGKLPRWQPEWSHLCRVLVETMRAVVRFVGEILEMTRTWMATASLTRSAAALKSLTPGYY